MDYDVDTLRSAKNNRDASQRYYKYLMTDQSSSSRQDHLIKPTTRGIASQEFGQMLHRSPSGAKRKIRQKGKDGAPRPSPFLSPSSSSQTSQSPSPTENSSNYRSLIDSGDYQSILPAFEPPMPPVPTPRLSVSYSNSMSSLDLSSTSSSSSAGFAKHYPPPPLPIAAKPTVEVHPMPTDERTSMSPSLNPSQSEMDIFKLKPPVPAKPKGLLIDHLNRSTSMTSLSSPIQHTTNTFLNNFMPTPSLINLQKGYRNPDLGSQDLAALENTRHESIQKVSHKLSTYEEEKTLIESELDEIDRTGHRLLMIVERHDKTLAARIRRYLEKSKELIAIETNLRLQMSKLDDRIHDGVIDRASALAEETYLRKRFQDTDFLRKISSRREQDYDQELSQIFTDDEFRRWLQFKECSTRLLKNETSMDYCIRESRMKLDALHLAPRSGNTSST